jgi:hypothetical protein
MASSKKHRGVIPGTVHLVNIDRSVAKHNLKAGVNLVPQPSEDPQDPLNWSRKRKLVQMTMIAFYVLGQIGTAFPSLTLADITRDTGISTAILVQAGGVVTILCGWTCLI